MQRQIGDKKVILSGIQPTNQITLGNYLGALRNWVQLQDQYRCYFAAVDLHSIVAGGRAEDLSDNTWYAFAAYVAAGLDPDKCHLFAQSHVAYHCELAWILNCFTWMGELGRMTQFKDKSAREGANIPAGLFNYPVLMAADILLYQASLVPVGEDQRQHLELTRTLARRVNNRYQQKLFTVPDPFIPKLGARIMDLRDPHIKMSKSNPHSDGAIFLSDDKDMIVQKMKRATTDSGRDIIFDPENKPGISNLLVIQAVILDLPIATVCEKYRNQGYGKLKADTADIVIQALQGIQKKMTELLVDKNYLRKILISGTQQAQETAWHTLSHVKAAIGFMPDESSRISNP